MEAVEVLEKRDALSDIVMWCGEEAGGAGGCLTILMVGSRLLDLVVTQISHWYLSSPVALSVKCGQMVKGVFLTSKVHEGYGCR